jgi:hypothetical protein
MEKAYGFKFSAEELKKLEENKFIIKNLTDLNISTSLSYGGYIREVAGLYNKISPYLHNSVDYK